MLLSYDNYSMLQYVLCERKIIRGKNDVDHEQKKRKKSKLAKLNNLPNQSLAMTLCENRQRKSDDESNERAS